MKTSTISFFIFSLLFLSCTTDGNDAINRKIDRMKEKYPVPVLNKTEMYADFDALVSIIERCNPQYLVRKKATGYDMIAEMKKQRVQVENCNNTLDFIRLLKYVMSLALDEHCYFGTSVWHYKNSFYKKDVKTSKITKRDFAYTFHYLHDVFYQNPPKINLIYIQGKYFLRNTSTFFNAKDSVIIPMGSEITTFNSQPLVVYMDSIRTYSSRWDFNRKQYYHSVLDISNLENIIGFKMDGKTIEYAFTKFVQEKKEWEPFLGSEFHHHWFSKDSILYFRIPSMSYSPQIMEQFKEKVLSYRSKPVKSVIIDIRGNTGGNDKVWTGLLGMIYETPIEYPSYFLSNTDKDVIERIQRSEKRLIPETRVLEYIDASHTFRVHEEVIEIIENHEQNLGYKGTVYLLVDEDIYSSSGAFASLCTKTDRIKTIGMSTGKFGGRGATPSVFILPNSRLIFTMELLLDAAGVSKAEDFYHDNVNYPITPSINYYKYWYDPNKPYEVDERAMYEEDEVFKMALEIIKKENN